MSAKRPSASAAGAMHGLDAPRGRGRPNGAAVAANAVAVTVAAPPAPHAPPVPAAEPKPPLRPRQTAAAVVQSTRSKQFVPSAWSRHFLIFDASLSRLDRIRFQMAVNLQTAALLHGDNPLGITPVPIYAAPHLVELRVINDIFHPAHGQIGLFAKEPLKTDTKVTTYSGIVEYCTTLTGSRTYTMGFGTTETQSSFTVDSEVCGDYGRFANDPRGTPFTDNVQAVMQKSKLGELCSVIVAKRPIAKGDEIFLGYGKEHQMHASAWRASTATADGEDGALVTRPRAREHVSFSQVRAAAMPPPPPPSAEAAPQPGGTKAPPPVLSMDFALCWRCMSCGSWSTRPVEGVAVAVCAGCHAPMITRSPACAALITTETVPVEKGGADDTEATVQDMASPSRKRQRLDPNRANSSTTAKKAHAPGASAAAESAASAAAANAAPAAPSPSSLLIGWPATVPFISWSIWDPAIDVSAVLDCSAYTPWPGIEGRVEGYRLIPRDLRATQAFARGQVVGPVGGLVVPLDHHVVAHAHHFRCPWIPLPPLRSHGTSETPLPLLALLVTNEFSCCRGIALRPVVAAGGGVGAGGMEGEASAGGHAANITVAFLRDELGACYAAAVATREIGPYDEIVFAAAPERP